MDWGKIGESAISTGISGAIGTGLGLLGSIGAAKRQRKAIEAQKNAQKELNEQAVKLNYEYGEKAAENAYERQLAMYNKSYEDQSYKTMVKQMEEAGLSVGLMYGGNGSGGGAGAMSGAPKADTGGAVAGQAANAAALMEVENQRKALALQQTSMAKDIQLKDAEIELKKKEAEKVGKESLYTEALTETENVLRNAKTHREFWEGRLSWIENLRKQFEDVTTPSEDGELNAMYERFQQRLQKEGLADAEGNPTEKTLEIRRQIVERKAEREKQAERQKKIAKRAKTTKHWVRTAKAAGVVLVVGACVFGASMTSEANRIRLVETISGVRNSGDVVKTNNGEDREYSSGGLDEEIKKISQILHIAVPEFYYIPTGMKYDKVQILEEAQMAIIRYQYNDHFVYFHLAANEKELSQGDWKDKEKVQIETLDDVIDVEMGSVSENNEENYYAKWKYKDSYYQLSGQIEKEELMKILSEMQYNL